MEQIDCSSQAARHSFGEDSGLINNMLRCGIPMKSFTVGLPLGKRSLLRQSEGIGETFHGKRREYWAY